MNKPLDEQVLTKLFKAATPEIERCLGGGRKLSEFVPVERFLLYYSEASTLDHLKDHYDNVDLAVIVELENVGTLDFYLPRAALTDKRSRARRALAQRPAWR